MPDKLKPEEMDFLQAIQFAIDNPKAIIANQDNERLYIDPNTQSVELTDPEGWDSCMKLTDKYRVVDSAEGLFDAEAHIAQTKERLDKIDAIKKAHPDKTMESIIGDGTTSSVVFTDGTKVAIE